MEAVPELTRTKPIRDALLALNFQKVAHELSKRPVTAETGADLLRMARQLGVFLSSFLIRKGRRYANPS